MIEGDNRRSTMQLERSTEQPRNSYVRNKHFGKDNDLQYHDSNNKRASGQIIVETVTSPNRTKATDPALSGRRTNCSTGKSKKNGTCTKERRKLVQNALDQTESMKSLIQHALNSAESIHASIQHTKSEDTLESDADRRLERQAESIMNDFSIMDDRRQDVSTKRHDRDCRRVQQEQYESIDNTRRALKEDGLQVNMDIRNSHARTRTDYQHYDQRETQSPMDDSISRKFRSMKGTIHSIREKISKERLLYPSTSIDRSPVPSRTRIPSPEFLMDDYCYHQPLRTQQPRYQPQRVSEVFRRSSSTPTVHMPPSSYCDKSPTVEKGTIPRPHRLEQRHLDLKEFSLKILPPGGTMTLHPLSIDPLSIHPPSMAPTRFHWESTPAPR